jgi:hypothetical protein
MRCGPVAALILAAGSSSRMGKNKALLDYHGRPFLHVILENLRHERPLGPTAPVIPRGAAGEPDFADPPRVHPIQLGEMQPRLAS